jgi:hypothetical protein
MYPRVNSQPLITPILYVYLKIEVLVSVYVGWKGFERRAAESLLGGDEVFE